MATLSSTSEPSQRPTVLWHQPAAVPPINPERFVAGLADGKLDFELGFMPEADKPHSAPVLSFARIEGGMATLGEDDRIIFWGADGSSGRGAVCSRCDVMAASSTGKTVLAGARNRAVLFDAASARSRITIPHTAAITALASSDAIAATGGEDGHVRLWDVATGMPIGFVRGHRDQITHAELASGTMLVTASMDGAVRVTDVAAVRLLSQIDPVRALEPALSWLRRLTGNRPPAQLPPAI